MEMDTKKQVIVCHKGRCSEEMISEQGFETQFNYTNIVDRIQRDLFNNMVK